MYAPSAVGRAGLPTAAETSGLRTSVANVLAGATCRTYEAPPPSPATVVVLGPVHAKLGVTFNDEKLAGVVGVEIAIGVAESTTIANGPAPRTLPATSAAVNRSWLVAPQGETPAQRT